MTAEARRVVTDDVAANLVPTVGDAVAAAIVARGHGRFRFAAYRALRWEVFEGHARALRHEPDARILTIEGDWSTFAHDVLKFTRQSAPYNLKEIVRAQAAVAFSLPDGSTESMLALHERPRQGRRRSSIEIVLGSMLLPHSSGRNALVPMLRNLPPMVGYNHEHGPLVNLSMLVVREFRIRARELADVGSVEIKPERFEALAREAWLPLAALRLALPRWLRDAKPKDMDDAPAFLASPSPGRFTLGPAHATELAFLDAAGRDVLA